MKNIFTKLRVFSTIICVFTFLLSTGYSFGATAIWTGATNSNWFTATNWNSGIVPDDTTDVVINNTFGHSPEISGAVFGVAAKCKSLTIAILNTLTISGGALFVFGEWHNSGTFNATGGTVVFKGNGGPYTKFAGVNKFFNLVIDTGVDPYFDNPSSSKIKVAGYFENNNSELFVYDAEFTFNGSGDQTIYSKTTPQDFPTFGTLIINKTSGSVKLLSSLGVGAYTYIAGKLVQNGFLFYVHGIITPFPVELVSFSAKISDNKVILNWLTATEVNNYGFEIQRSIEFDKWDVLGFIEGNGNSNSPKEYNFTDSAINSAGTYSYRLKQINNDGSYEFSKTIEVNIGSPISLELNQNYPNPFNPTTTIRFTLPQSGSVILKIYNSIGEEIATLTNGFLEAGVYTFNFNAEGLPSGMYIYRLSTPENTQMRKMILMK